MCGRWGCALFCSNIRGLVLPSLCFFFWFFFLFFFFFFLFFVVVVFFCLFFFLSWSFLYLKIRVYGFFSHLYHSSLLSLSEKWIDMIEILLTCSLNFNSDKCIYTANSAVCPRPCLGVKSFISLIQYRCCETHNYRKISGWKLIDSKCI